VSATPQDVWSQIDTGGASDQPKDIWANLDKPSGPTVTPSPKQVTPFFTQIGHAAEDLAGSTAHAAGNLVDIATGTTPGKGSHAEAWSQFAQHEPDYTGEPYDIKEQVRQGLPKIDPYNVIPKGPAQDTARMYVPQFLEGASTVAGLGGAVKGAMGRSAAQASAGALEEGHPLTAAAQSEIDQMQTHAATASAAGVDLPPREVSPAQAFANNAARQDLSLPKNAPITSGLIDAAQEQNVSPAYKAVEKVPEFQLGPGYQDAISKVKLDKIDPEFRPPTSGTMTGEEAVDSSKQLRSVARGLYQDADNFNLTSVQQNQARTAAQAHYQAAKAVEGGFREAATAQDAANTAAGTPTTAGADAADAWDQARIYNAKAETWRGALDGAGNVIAPKIKKLLNDEPITGPMKDVASVAAQYPELFRGTRLQTPTEGVVKRGIRAVAPLAGAAIGAHAAGTLGSMGGAALGEYAANKALGTPYR
jgi:hypothetical protein